MRANNKSAVIPSILPAMLLLIVNLILFFTRPVFMPLNLAIFSEALNVIALISTFVWQRKLQGEMAIEGYDESKIKLLISTNWIRTAAFILQAILAVSIIINSVN
jgi:hypothetical protein